MSASHVLPLDDAVPLPVHSAQAGEATPGPSAHLRPEQLDSAQLRAGIQRGRRRNAELPTSAAASAEMALAIAIVKQANACGARAAAELIQGRAVALGVQPAEVAATIVHINQVARSA